MSVEAITWALKQKCPSSTAKFVLVALANNARAEGGEAWPSLAALCAATQQDRKTVVANLGRLVEAGLIVECGKTGRTKQVNVYRLDLENRNRSESGTVMKAHKEKRNDSKSGTVPEVVSNSTVSPVEQSRFSPETVPKTVPGTVKEPSKEPLGNRQRHAEPATVDVALLVEAGIEREVALEFIVHKSRVKAPLTARAWVDHVREAERAGWTPQQAAEKVMAKSWKGFEAAYVAKERPPQPTGQAETFRERDQRVAAAEAAKWGGRPAPRPMFDVEEASYVDADGT